MSPTEPAAAAVATGPAGAAPGGSLAAIAGWVGRVSWVLCVVAAAMGLLLPLPVLYEILMDQLNDPPSWVFETTGYTIIMIVFAASGYGLRTGHHFRVSLLPDRFPALARP